MADRLVGCLIKFDRALTHLEILKESIKGFKEAQTNRYPGKFDPDSGQYVFRVEARPIPKIEWGGLIGDVLHNLRASLDYLAWELVDCHSPGQGNGRTEFPIFLSPEKFKQSAPAKTKGMSPEACAVIERLQPFKESPAERHPSENLLWVLQSLVTVDKHRTLTLTAEAIGLHWEGLPPGVHAADPNFLQEEYTTATVTLNPGPNPERWVNVEFVASSDVCFAPRGPAGGEFVIPTLWDIAYHICERVVPQLRRFVT